MTKVTIAQIIDAIEQRQPVLNKEVLSQAQLNRRLEAVGSLSTATANQLSFLSSSHYLEALQSTAAGALIIMPDHASKIDRHNEVVLITTANPYLGYASASQLFEPALTTIGAHHDTDRDRDINRYTQANDSKIHATAVIAPSAKIGKNVFIGAYSVIVNDVIIGDNCHLANQVTVEDGVILGTNCTLLSQVVIAHHCHLGNNVRVHAHASIGSEGFGFAPSSNTAEAGWERIAQLGRVIIGNNVRIGSQTCIDRGAIEDTVIEDNVIIDNQVQIAHNVVIGAGTAIAAQTGIAGSARIGRRCMIGGAVGIAGHLTITDDVSITGTTFVTKSITQSGSYSSGTIAMPSAEWRRAAVRFRQMGKK